MSPNYPNTSPPGLNYCSWTIEGPADADLLLSFDYAFHMARNDSLKVMWYIYFVNNLHVYLKKL